MPCVLLQDVSFTLHPGQVTALVGPSGSGKSSCVSLLEHFYRAQAGQVLLDGTPIEEYDHRYLHTKVPQIITGKHNALAHASVPSFGSILTGHCKYMNVMVFHWFVQVSLVGQEPVLFARSVQENIAYGLTDCSLEEIVQASMKANAHGFITELPDGYSTGREGREGGRKEGRTLIRFQDAVKHQPGTSRQEISLIRL